MLKAWNYLNTSHVNVQLTLDVYAHATDENLNTSHVNVQL